MDVHKTWKLFVGGAFPRSESGRSYVPARAPDVNVARASRKDVRDAVVAARKGLADWAGRDACNRGQILYRIGEMLDGRRDALVSLLRTVGEGAAEARREVRLAAELVTWYAGLPDKLQSLLGSQNAVSGPFFDFSTVEPTGVVGVAAPERPSLAGMLALVLPLLAGGNAVVAVAGERAPLPALALGEVLASADVPAGTVNLLAGHRDELVPVLAAHRDVDGLLLAGRPDAEVGAAAAESVKRVRWAAGGPSVWRDRDRLRSLAWVEPFVEVKSFWHPVAP